MTDAERIEVVLVENLQRSDGIPVLAEATGYFRLVGEYGYSTTFTASRQSPVLLAWMHDHFADSVISAEELFGEDADA